MCCFILVSLICQIKFKRQQIDDYYIIILNIYLGGDWVSEYISTWNFMGQILTKISLSKNLKYKLSWKPIFWYNCHMQKFNIKQWNIQEIFSLNYKWNSSLNFDMSWFIMGEIHQSCHSTFLVFD